jgi:hypothetical protein
VDHIEVGGVAVLGVGPGSPIEQVFLYSVDGVYFVAVIVGNPVLLVALMAIRLVGHPRLDCLPCGDRPGLRSSAPHRANRALLPGDRSRGRAGLRDDRPGAWLGLASGTRAIDTTAIRPTFRSWTPSSTNTAAERAGSVSRAPSSEAPKPQPARSGPRLMTGSETRLLVTTPFTKRPMPSLPHGLEVVSMRSIWFATRSTERSPSSSRTPQRR